MSASVFNAKKLRTESGKVIQIKPVPLGSGETVDELLTERRKSHLCSPASGAYVGQWLQSFREFPPRQKPGSFNLDG